MVALFFKPLENTRDHSGGPGQRGDLDCDASGEDAHDERGHGDCEEGGLSESANNGNQEQGETALSSVRSHLATLHYIVTIHILC